MPKRKLFKNTEEFKQLKKFSCELCKKDITKDQKIYYNQGSKLHYHERCYFSL